MNGPRTYQFEAPTSFITSISRRRAKIESRIVFPIRIVAAPSRITIASTDRTSKMCATRRIRVAVFLPKFTFSTPAGGGSRLFAIATTSSPCFGLILNASGNGFARTFATMSGAFFFIFSSACCLEMYSTFPGPIRGSFWSLRRTAFFSATVTSWSQVVRVQR